jgi:hypothetical protein
MDDHKVAILLEDLLVKFQTFGEGQEAFRGVSPGNAGVETKS